PSTRLQRRYQCGPHRQGQPPSGTLRRRPQHPSEFRSRARRRRAQLALGARTGAGSEKFLSRRAQDRQAKGGALMPQVIDLSGKVVREEPTPELLGREYADKQHAIFRAVFRELSNPRAGTSSTKKRDEVSGGGR